MVDLPHEAGLRGIAHPGDDGRGGMEELRVAAFVHGAEGLVVRQLRLAHKVGEVGDRAVAAGDDAGIDVAVLVALGQVVLGPVVVDRSPNPSCGIMPWMDSSVGMETLPVSVLKKSSVTL